MTHNKAKRKHDGICKSLEELLKGKHNYDNVLLHYEYALGECDILCCNKTRDVYYEVKGNYSEKNYNKAQEQLNRWTDYAYKGNKNCYGVLYTPQRVYILSKNGNYRNIRTS